MESASRWPTTMSSERSTMVASSYLGRSHALAKLEDKKTIAKPRLRILYAFIIFHPYNNQASADAT